MAEEQNKQQDAPLSHIETIRKNEIWLERAHVLFQSNPEKYGSIEAPTKVGFIELAKLGKDAWNIWIKKYPKPVPDFSGVDFQEIDIDFSKYTFPSKNDEEPCVDFSHATFGEHAHFSKAIFGKRADFSHTVFDRFATFYRTIFGSEANFHAAFFGDGPYFFEAEFGNSANFDSAHFGRAAYFNGVILGNHANFRNANFAEFACFSASTNSDAELGRLRFQSISFSGARFEGEARFTGRRFESTTDFGRLPKIQSREERSLKASNLTSLVDGPPTKFKGLPNFHGCIFHQDTNFDSAEFTPLSGPEAARAYRTLKLAMEKLKATREEQRFFRLEMKAEHPNLKGGKRWLSTLYSLFSDYGFSLFRPAVWLLALSLFFGASYGVLADLCVGDQECVKSALHGNVASVAERTTAVLKYTLASAAPVPGLDKMQTELRAPLFGQHGWIAIASLTIEILHKIIAIALTFLFALALRNLFKMKS